MMSNLTKKLRKVILCSGKIYHDLKKQRDENNQSDIAIVQNNYTHFLMERN